jgi:hypothetical protein
MCVPENTSRPASVPKGYTASRNTFWKRLAFFIGEKHKNPPEFLPAGPCSYEKEENEGVEED